MSVPSGFLPAAIKRFRYYKELGDRTFMQLTEEDLFYQPSAESNNIAIIIQHLHGNAKSRWTNFLTEDGEKEWRNRDEEFENTSVSKSQLLSLWTDLWQLMFSTLENLKEEDLAKVITIRNEPLTVFDAILRQLAHYPYHIGQIVYLGKLVKGESWQSLTIEKGKSIQFNQSLRK